MIDLTIHDEAALARAVQRARDRNIIIPTFAQQRNPGLIPGAIRHKLAEVGLWDLNPVNLFRINWHNEPVARGGGYGGVNYLELPGSITGVDARVVVITGKWFPTGAHKVGAAYGCLVPRLVTGQFDPTTQKAVWPSTGNYCRGGAYDSHLLGCESIAILPEGMSKERFAWLEGVADEIIRTPGSESTPSLITMTSISPICSAYRDGTNSSGPDRSGCAAGFGLVSESSGLPGTDCSVARMSHLLISKTADRLAERIRRSHPFSLSAIETALRVVL